MINLDENNIQALPIIKGIENPDLLFISYSKELPKNYRNISISITFGVDGIKVGNNLIPDPSTIYACLPIDNIHTARNLSLDYYPNYIDMLPEQRFYYLNWLRNVEEKIDIGYVFLYYYGLERNLLIGNFEKAFNEIIRLRNIHKNRSFQQYTENALIYSCIMNKRPDLLIDLHEKTEISCFLNAQFMLAKELGLDLSAENLLLVFKKAFVKSRNALKENPSLLLECVNFALIKKYNKKSFSIKEYRTKSIKKTLETRFANYSFPRDIQHITITDFYQSRSLMKDMESIFDIAYDEYRKRKLRNRKLINPNKLIEYFENETKSSTIERYDRLLIKNYISDNEFNTLIDKIK
jgi:hypothetical protein